MDTFRNSPLKLSGSLRRYDMANSPFHKYILNTEERRSQLFPDRRKVPGRKAKSILAVALVLQIWGLTKVLEIRRFWDRRDEDIKKGHRKSVPFLQAMSDLRYCSLAERNQMFITELFRHKGDEYLKNITQRFHQKDLWAPFSHRSRYLYGGESRYSRPMMEIEKSRYLHGYDMYNI